MTYFIVVNERGVILQSGSTNVEDLDLLQAHYLTGTLIEVEQPVHDCNAVYWAGAAVVAKPAKPSPFHEFDYTNLQWLINPVMAWQGVKDQRNMALAASDWTQLPDVPLQTKAAWAAYRQALRDLTNQPDPLAIEWPAQPTEI